MSNYYLAHPYAEAIFSHAKDTKTLGAWSRILETLAMVVGDAQAQAFLRNPFANAVDILDMLMSITEADLKDKSILEALIMLLIHNKRILVIPAIRDVFESMRAEEEKSVQVIVRSMDPLTSGQRKKLKQALTRRLSRDVTLEEIIDPEVLGSAVIEAGDFVLDGSILGQLNRLRNELVL
jgi:F-type H+-transporting ATPase subunit delta